MQNQNKSVLLKDKDTLLSMHGILYVCILFFLLSLSLALSDSPYHIISDHTLSMFIIWIHTFITICNMLVLMFHGW